MERRKDTRACGIFFTTSVITTSGGRVKFISKIDVFIVFS